MCILKGHEMLQNVAAIVVGAALVQFAFRLCGDYNLHVEKSVNVHETMNTLARSYFDQSILLDGIQKNRFEEMVMIAGRPYVSRGATMIIQVIDGQVYADRSYWSSPAAWDILRSTFILEELRHLVQKETFGNFEFILNTADCPMRNYSLPGVTFSMTKCQGKGAVPLPQWFNWRDGKFSKWDKRIKESFAMGREVKWSNKEGKAVFRGNLRETTMWRDHKGYHRMSRLNDANWHTFGRGKLWYLQSQHPDLFDVGLDTTEVAPPPSMNWTKRPYISMQNQVRRFKYAVYVEGHCGWADRLKNQLASGMVLFLQETVCHEFFLRLMKPWVHYIPIRYDLDDLVDKIKWARGNDEEVSKIGVNAAIFAKTLLSKAAWRSYFKAVIRTYTGLVRYEPERRPNARRFIRAPRCKPNQKARCPVDHCFSPF